MLKTRVATRLYLKIHDLFFVQFTEGNAAGHQDGRGLRHPEDLPADALKEGRQFGLDNIFQAMSKCNLEPILPNFVFMHWALDILE